ncbi:MAG: AMP-binding protein [Candidatus Hydrogenedentes bacterium]|nr:AMP-binding protein [Candidatus Hydrogenedentota bacterium]
MKWNEFIAARADRVFLEEAGRPLMTGAFFDRMRAAADNLVWLGMSAPGILTAFQASPALAMVEYLFSVIHAGGVALPLNPHFPESYKQDIERRLGAGSLKESASTGVDWDAPATLVLTSGSSSFPKAVAHSLRGHLASAAAANTNIALAPGDRWLFSLPLYHVSGLGILFRCLEAGATVVMPPLEGELLHSIRALRITHCSLVAAQLQRCMEAEGGVAALRNLKAVLLGGSAIPPALIDRAHAAGLPLHTSYGLTECASQICCTRPGANREELSTSGYPLGADRVRINAAGVIEVGGPSLMLGYWQDGALDRPFTEDGWFATRDLGAWDAAGRLHVLGRADNVFVCGGENVQPEEVERALLTLEGVLQAVVAPVPHPVYGATVVAIVESEVPIGEVAAAWRTQLQALLPKHAVPRHFLPWPVNHAEHAAIKVSREKLRAYAEAVLHSQ